MWLAIWWSDPELEAGGEVWSCILTFSASSLPIGEDERSLRMTTSPSSAGMSTRSGGGEVGSSGGGQSGRLGRDAEEDLKLESSFGASKLSGDSKIVLVTVLCSSIVSSIATKAAVFGCVSPLLISEVFISKGSGSDMRVSNSWCFFFHSSFFLWVLL